jgi:hypothetical protein
MLELPDWGYWGRLRTMSMRDALVLSIGLCPHKYNHENTDATELSYAQKYWDNLQIARNHVYDSDWLVGRAAKQDGDVDTTHTEVDFEKFCVWASIDVQLSDLPPEMRILGGADLEDSNVSNDLVNIHMPEVTLNKRHPSSMRDDVIGNAINRAMKAVSDPNSSQQVWQKLCEYVDKNEPPFIGFDDSDIKYTDSGEVKFLSKSAVRRRIKRSLK